MKAAVYYSLIAIMLLGVLPCLYEYNLYSQMETEQLKTNAILAGNGSFAYGADPLDGNDVLNNDISTIKAEKMGFFGAAAALFLIPALMLLFRGRLLKN